MFGMTRDLGRKKQERRKSSNRLPKSAYTLDKRLVPRVKEVPLNAACKPTNINKLKHKDGTYIAAVNVVWNVAL